ncbi:MAG: amidohydrolase family protein [Emergencia sp.]
MAFGIFKKKEAADIIYRNGHIYTQDPQFPWAESVACRDGRVMAVGDFEGMDGIISEDTQIVDLKERYMFPGFIDVHGTPVMQAFEGKYLLLDPVWDLDTVVQEVTDYAEMYEGEIVFAYGYNEHILEDYSSEDARELLDGAEGERPVVLLGISGFHCWLNTAAYEIISAAAEEEGLEFVSAGYILNQLPPFDFEEVESMVLQQTSDLADRGFTSVLNLCSPDYFGTIYQDCLLAMIGEGEDIRQRFFGSLYINRPINPELILHKLSTEKTNCTELDGQLQFNMLKLEVSQDENLAFFPQEALDTICLLAAERGFDIHLDALDRASFEQACQTFDMLRAKGCRSSALTLASDSKPDEDAPFMSTWPTDYLNRSVFGHVSTVEEAIDNLTVRAAQILGMDKTLGVIERGRIADFTVFEENPFDAGLHRFSGMHADMTVVDGSIVYDADEASADEMYDLMRSMQL